MGLRRVPVWMVYCLGMVPAFWGLWLGLTGGLGAEPVRALEQHLGETALQFLIAVLAITPLRRAGVNLVRFRRALGVLSFVYVCLHLGVWLLDLRSWPLIWADLVKRPYITVGMAAGLLLVPLALTSNDRAVRRLGPARWRRLHRLTYPAVSLGGVHYLMLVKGWPAAPILYMAVIITLLSFRIRLLRVRFPA
ncbi:protein-methionine-sulfoxide reductase heme-binding subunit MsrQ [Rhodovulum imhoffii]|nr:protein-methionine-sulfoxide reductase heme-binding subunit MsrQ [Rhodovulum imhoffii]MBK5934272.1 sulfoxide reductase heme-binding subunit YedZ [Rhodovulum imhoffii]